MERATLTRGRKGRGRRLVGCVGVGGGRHDRNGEGGERDRRGGLTSPVASCACGARTSGSLECGVFFGSARCPCGSAVPRLVDLGHTPAFGREWRQSSRWYALIPHPTHGDRICLSWRTNMLGVPVHRSLIESPTSCEGGCSFFLYKMQA